MFLRCRVYKGTGLSGNKNGPYITRGKGRNTWALMHTGEQMLAEACGISLLMFPASLLLNLRIRKEKVKKEV